MAFASFSDSDSRPELAEINMVPLIDVMLVLLVIFIVAAPMLTHSVALDLPQANAGVVQSATPAVHLDLDAQGRLYWDGALLANDALAERLALAATLYPAPELRFAADGTTPYARVAQVMAAATHAGLTRIAFITRPES